MKLALSQSGYMYIPKRRLPVYLWLILIFNNALEVNEFIMYEAEHRRKFCYCHVSFIPELREQTMLSIVAEKFFNVAFANVLDTKCFRFLTSLKCEVAITALWQCNVQECRSYSSRLLHWCGIER
ncbi:hypothetical protein M514_00196 [Trichuris suis]|uniref:Uncharacterized protein n=1 Tax=Trichuris suis TaxID=68888 RepID=A0A085NUC2_9BILA|nr:hypothetical protein M513_00196 [Trichuris suis]KFD73068.1 hypothetical protein M514_00196 [Trichuris suis]